MSSLLNSEANQSVNKPQFQSSYRSGARTSRQFKAMPVIPVKHPMLEAFKQSDRGKLFVKTPEGAGLSFEGWQEGPSATLILHSWSALDAIIAEGETGFANAYMNGQWDSDDVPTLITWALLNARSLEQFFYGKPFYALWTRIKCTLLSNTLLRSRSNVKAHYDVGNRFYELWLDDSMTYSCGLFGDHPEISLEEAQQNKYRRILGRLNAAPSSRILDIGCGWGAFAEFAARQKLRVHGITISDEQKLYAEKRLRDQGLDRYADIELVDYREAKGIYDYIVSIGMFEHVGQQYWGEYFRAVKSHLRVGGKAMIQSITLDDAVFERLKGKFGFVEQYVFPGGCLPSKTRFFQAAERAGLKCTNMYAFGQDYALTLKHWLARFDAQHEKIRAMGHGESFIRMWRFYLSACMASFRARRTDVMQAELVHA